MTPILYSFRRCPYAMRARLALQMAGVETHLREVVLREKPQAFLSASQSGTVPCLVSDEVTLDESLDIMIWALRKNDPQGWLDMPSDGWALIEQCDGPFKIALDRTKYATRYPGVDPEVQRAGAMRYLSDLDGKIDQWIFDKPSIADYAILPFIRQFAFIDKSRFDAEAGPKLRDWLARFLADRSFEQIMRKYPKWVPGDAPVVFPKGSA